MPEIPKEPPVSDSQFRSTRNTMMLNPSVTMARKWCLTFSAGKPTTSPQPNAERRAEPASPSSKGSPRWPRIATAYDAERHEGGVRQRDLPGIAQGEVEADGHHR